MGERTIRGEKLCWLVLKGRDRGLGRRKRHGAMGMGSGSFGAVRRKVSVGPKGGRGRFGSVRWAFGFVTKGKGKGSEGEWHFMWKGNIICEIQFGFIECANHSDWLFGNGTVNGPMRKCKYARRLDKNMNPKMHGYIILHPTRVLN